MKKKSSYNYEELIRCGNGKLFGPGNAKLPLPPMLMFDRISEISENKGTYKRGLIIYSRRSRGGNTGDHFMICPPLTINNKQIKELMNILNKSIESFAKTAKLIEK